ncbi:MAG: M23 family metallopeptidase [Clostridia bacterium]|nr:M23 family metallopeptidase [Clostridia bacterium]
MIKETKKIEQNKEPGSSSDMQYIQPEKPHFAECLARNMALAGMLLLTVVAVRNAKLPSGQTVLTAVQQIIEPGWDDNLGKINFVSNLFPDTVAVFFQMEPDIDLTAPCFGAVTHTWSNDEPYIGYQAANGRVYAAGDGQVMSIAHGMEDERIIRVRHDNGIETLYYNLADVNVGEGDSVTATTCLGTSIAGQTALLEVRRAGKPINATAWLTSRTVP